MSRPRKYPIQEKGNRFGRLVLLELSKERIGTNEAWVAKCDCGTVVLVATSNLCAGHTNSCGCLSVEHCIKMGKQKATHRMKGTRLYRIWTGIKTRCLNKKD